MLPSHWTVPVHKLTVLCFLGLLTLTLWYLVSGLSFLCLPETSQDSMCSSVSSGKRLMINMNVLPVSPLLRRLPRHRSTTVHSSTQSHKYADPHDTKHTDNSFTRQTTGFEIVNMAKEVTSANKGPLLLTIVNKGYLPLTFNWLCHTTELPGVHENLIFLVQGKETQVRLNQRWPSVKTLTVNQTNDELLGPLKFGTVGYVRMMVRRTELLNALVQANISFVLFETDFIWFENPVPEFIKMGQEKNLDLVGTVSTAETQLMCGAFIYFRNTSRMRKLWAEVTRQMHELEDDLRHKRDKDKAPYRQNEQVFLNHLLRANFEGARYGLVDYDMVVDGRWYKMNSSRQKAMSPVAIHNNFQTTPQQKMRRFQRFGHWVLDRNLSCNQTKIDRLMRSQH